MIQLYQKSSFKKMSWKNGKGITTQVLIFPESATLEENDFLFRLSSAAVNENGDFSLFTGKNRILVPIKGAGFQLNEHIYEKFEIAHFSGDEKVNCVLLQGPVLDVGMIYDPDAIKAHPRILNLKTDLSFSLDPSWDYTLTVLSGEVAVEDKSLTELETAFFSNESRCDIKVKKSAILLLIKLEK